MQTRTNKTSKKKSRLDEALAKGNVKVKTVEELEQEGKLARDTMFRDEPLESGNLAGHARWVGGKRRS